MFVSTVLGHGALQTTASLQIQRTTCSYSAFDWRRHSHSFFRNACPDFQTWNTKALLLSVGVALFYHSSRQNCIDLLFNSFECCFIVRRNVFVNSRLTTRKIRKRSFLQSLWVIITRSTQQMIPTECKVKCMLLRDIARPFEVLFNYLLGLKKSLRYNSLFTFWPSDLWLSFRNKSAKLPVSPYLALKLWIVSPGDGFALWNFSENVNFPTQNS
jgi:hypothetical protein